MDHREADRREYRDGDYRWQDALGEYAHSRRDYRGEDYHQKVPAAMTLTTRNSHQFSEP